MATMKSWHIVVLEGWKEIEHKEKFDVAESKTTFTEMQEKYPKEKFPKYVIKREWY